MPTVSPSSLLTLAVSLALSAGAAADPTLLKVSGSVRGPDGGWDYVSLDTVTNRLYVARSYGVMAVDLANNKVTPVLIKGNHVHGVLPLPGGTMVSTNDDSSTATLFKAEDGVVLASFHTGRKPDAIAYEGKTGLVAVMNSKDGTVILIDPVKQTEVGRITVGGTLEFAEGDGQGRVFVNVKDHNELAVLDIAGRNVAARYMLPQCDSPTGLALDTPAKIALATCENAKAVALSTEDGHVVATLPIGDGPDAAILDAKKKRFLIPCGGNGVLTIIGEKPDGTLTVDGTIPTAKGARTGAIDPATGKLYLPTADFEARKPGDWQGAIVPGSFRILVLSERRSATAAPTRASDDSGFKRPGTSLRMTNAKQGSPATAQGGPIGLDFMLTLHNANGQTKIIGDADPIKMHRGQPFTLRLGARRHGDPPAFHWAALQRSEQPSLEVPRNVAHEL